VHVVTAVLLRGRTKGGRKHVRPSFTKTFKLANMAYTGVQFYQINGNPKVMYCIGYFTYKAHLLNEGRNVTPGAQ